MATVNEKMTAIADAIRDKTGETNPLTLDDVAIDIPKVYDAGKNAQYDEFWDNYQAPMIAGKNVPNMFSGSCWNGTTFYPKYDIKPVYGTNLFNYFSWDVTPWIDLAQRLEECGVTLDTSQTSTIQMFSNCNVTRIPKIDATFQNSMDRTFRSTTATVIDELALKENGANTFSNIFQGCSNLEEIRITGLIGKNGFSVSDSKKLSRDSILGVPATDEQIATGKNLIELNGVYYWGGIWGALQDYSTDTSGTTYTVTLGTTNLAKLTNEEKAIATQKGWTLA